MSASTPKLDSMTVDPGSAPSARVERVTVASHGRLERQVLRRDGSVSRSYVKSARTTQAGGLDLESEYDLAWLKGNTVDLRDSSVVRPRMRVADLFSGCGGLTVGASEAARALNLDVEHVLALDTDAEAMKVYVDNFSPTQAVSDPVETLVDRSLGSALSASERRLRDQVGSLSLALGGPPCQGHSDLNNHTRRNDPKNDLYLAMARFVEVTRPEHVVIENVPGVVHSRRNVVGEATAHLRSIGYHVSAGVAHAARLGAAQSRRRHLLLASRINTDFTIETLAEAHERLPRPALWAIDDLGADGTTAFDTSSNHADVNKRRIRYLFEHGVFDLPNSERPDCHRLKTHTYTSVYGRMHPDRPAPTITSGFGSTGQGRFVHPLEPRTLTPHEAARLQGFPDSFCFESVPQRTHLAKMIGNAVPSRLAYAAVLELLR